MLRIDFGLIFTIINLLVLYFAMRKFLFKPVHRILEERQARITRDLQEAEQAKTNARALEAQHGASLKGIEAEKNRAIAEARSAASVEYNRIVADAKTHADSIIEEAVTEGENKKAEIIKEARSEITELILAATARVIGVGNANDSALYDEFLEKAGNANDQARV